MGPRRSGARLWTRSRCCVLVPAGATADVAATVVGSPPRTRPRDDGGGPAAGPLPPPRRRPQGDRGDATPSSVVGTRMGRRRVTAGLPPPLTRLRGARWGGPSARTSPLRTRPRGDRVDATTLISHRCSRCGQGLRTQGGVGGRRRCGQGRVALRQAGGGGHRNASADLAAGSDAGDAGLRDLVRRGDEDTGLTSRNWLRGGRVAAAVNLAAGTPPPLRRPRGDIGNATSSSAGEKRTRGRQ